MRWSRKKRQRYDNVPYGDVMELLNALTFPPDHPYGHTTIGSMEDLDAATLEDVHAFFRRHYVPNNAVLSIVGDVEPEEALERAETYFGHLTPGAQHREGGRAASAFVQCSAYRDLWQGASGRGVPLLAAAARGGRISTRSMAFSILAHGQTSRLHKQLIRRTEHAESASTIGLIGGNSFGFSLPAETASAPNSSAGNRRADRPADHRRADEDELRAQSPVRAPLVAVGACRLSR